MIFISVDLPAPFSPSTAWISPGATSRSMPSLATTAGYALRMPESRSRGATAAHRRAGLQHGRVDGHRGFAQLQQLRGDGDGDDFGLLARNAGQADRAGHARECVGAEAAALEPLLEAAALGARTDQAEVAEVAARENRLAEIEIQRVAVGHDEKARARGRRGHLGQRRVGRLHADVRRRLGGEFVIAAVDPGHGARQRAEHPRDRAADVAGAEQHHVQRRMRRRLEEP